jgi:hypothetical protein
MWRAMTIGAAALAAAGCASVQTMWAHDANRRMPDMPTLNELQNCEEKAQCRDDAARRRAALRDYRNAARFCGRVASYHFEEARYNSASRLLLGALGTVAGAVISPALAARAASKSAIAAWAGVSGATNALLTEVESGPLSVAESLGARDAGVRARQDFNDRILEETDAQKIVLLSQMMMNACTDGIPDDNGGGGAGAPGRAASGPG